MFSTLNGLKFEISFLLGLPFPSGISDAVLAFYGETFCVILVLMASGGNAVKKLAESFMSLGGIVPLPLAFLYLDFSDF